MSEVSFAFLVGALLCEVDLFDPEARVLLALAVGALICVKSVLWTSEANLFCTVLSCGEVDLCELRGTSFAFPYCGCSPLGEVGVVDL